jgi:hypothetical protein
MKNNPRRTLPPRRPAALAVAGLLCALSPLGALAGEIVMTLEEPAANGTYSGVANLRGWAVSSAGIDRVELFVDGVYKTKIPIGGSRADVEKSYPNYPNSRYSGFSMAYAYGLIGSGTHEILVRVIDKDNTVKDAVANITVTGFDKAYIADPNAIDLSGATVTGSGNTLNIKGMKADGKLYDVVAQWNTQSQGMQFNAIGAAAGQGGGGGTCVTVPWVATGTVVKWSLSGTSGGQSVSGDIETNWVAVSTTGSLTETHSTTSTAGYSSVSDSTTQEEFYVSNDMLYVSKVTVDSSTTVMGYTIVDHTEITHQPAWLSGAAGRMCEGQTWTSEPVNQTTVSTWGGTIQGQTERHTGTVQSVNAAVTTPAGSFTTTKVRTQWDDGEANVVWTDLATGVMVRQEVYDANGALTQTTQLVSVQ